MSDNQIPLVICRPIQVLGWTLIKSSDGLHTLWSTCRLSSAETRKKWISYYFLQDKIVTAIHLSHVRRLTHVDRDVIRTIHEWPKRAIMV